jgi:hypothetical protein
MKHLKLIKTTKHNNGKTIYWFEVNNELEKAIFEWKSNEFLKEYLGCVKQVKNMF